MTLETAATLVFGVIFVDQVLVGRITMIEVNKVIDAQ